MSQKEKKLIDENKRQWKKILLCNKKSQRINNRIIWPIVFIGSACALREKIILNFKLQKK